jgi:hypothetical protein
MENADQQAPPKTWNPLKAVLGIALGIIPGFCYWFFKLGPEGASASTPIVLGVLGGFIGAMLSRPDVSAGNVLKGVAATTVAYNAPRALRKPLLDLAFRDDKSEDKKTASGEADRPSG